LWCASIPAKELPVGQAVPRRLVNVRIPRILIGMQERAEEAGLDLRGGNFVLPPDHEHLVAWMEQVRGAIQPAANCSAAPPLSAQQRGAIEVVSWAIHSRSGMCGHGARRRDNPRPATAHPRAMDQIERRHLTSEEFRQLESRLPEIVRARYARCKPPLNSNRGFQWRRQIEAELNAFLPKAKSRRLRIIVNAMW
jgi:hypothetical protein